MFNFRSSQQYLKLEEIFLGSSNALNNPYSFEKCDMKKINRQKITGQL